MSNVQLAQSLYDNFASGNIPAVLAGFHPEVHWREAEGNPYQPDGSPWIGAQAIVDNLFMRIGAEWDGFQVNIGTLHDAGDCVVMEGRYTGLYKPTGRTVDAQACHVLRFRGGKLVSFQQYVDTAKLQAALGAND